MNSTINTIRFKMAGITQKDTSIVENLSYFHCGPL